MYILCILYTTSAAFASYFQRSVRIRVYWPEVRAGWYHNPTPRRLSYSLSLSLSRHRDLHFVTGNATVLILSYYVGFVKFPGECIIVGEPVEGHPKILDNFVGIKNLNTNMNKWKLRKNIHQKWWSREKKR